MRIEVLGWCYENIRGGIRDITIDLDNRPRWTLLQMPNGTGKTTTMRLLRAVMTGAEFTPEEIDELKAEDDTTEGAFELRLEIDGQPYRVRLELDFVGKSASYITTRAAEHSGGAEEGLNLPKRLRRLMTPEFARLFIFDGELAKEIRSEGKDRTTKSIRALHRLEQLDYLKVEIRKLVFEQQKRAAKHTSAKGPKGVKRLQKALAKANNDLARLSSQLECKKQERSSLKDEREGVNKKISNRKSLDDRFGESRKELNRQLERAKEGVAQRTRDTHASFRSPPQLGKVPLERLRGLGSCLTTLKLPKTISTEFFTELSEAEYCVCDREIGEKEKSAILAGAERYLAEDQITVINRMKQAVRKSDSSGNEFTNQALELKTSLRELKSIDQNLEALNLEEVKAGNDALAKLLIEQKKIGDELNALDEAIEQLGTTDPSTQRRLALDKTNNVQLARLHRDDCKKKLAAATDTLRFSTAADTIDSIIGRIGDNALEKLRESVREATNEKLSLLAKGEALQVSKIGSSLEISSSETRRKGGVSEGQSLAVAYAFISSLLGAAPLKLPFIVDSPAVSLDLRVRREVGKLVPELFDQMIMFVISTERSGFADSFDNRDSVLYITVWRDDDSQAHMQIGKEYFDHFHSEEDDEGAA